MPSWVLGAVESDPTQQLRPAPESCHPCLLFLVLKHLTPESPDVDRCNLPWPVQPGLLLPSGPPAGGCPLCTGG